MEFIFIYLAGVILGIPVWYIRKKISKRKEETHVFEAHRGKKFKKQRKHGGYEIPDENTKSLHGNIEARPYNKKYPGRSNKKVLLTSALAFAFVIVLIATIIFIFKYDLWTKVLPIIRNILVMARNAFLILFGLCTPYLTERTTKKLNKMRKRRKKRRKKKDKDKKKKKKKKDKK